MTRRTIPALAAVMSCVLGLSACKTAKAPPVSKTPTMADSAEQVMVDVRTLLLDKGVRRGDLVADTAFIFDDQTRFVFRNARVKFDKENGAPNGTMRADRGVYNMRTQILEGYGNVVVTSTDGRRLTAPQLKYNQLANEVTSDSAFVFVAGDKIQRGIGFKSDPNLTHLQIIKAASGSGIVNTFPTP
jgi:LPS export ABC transporter protein LptC